MERRQAKHDQREDNTINKVMEVVKLGPGFWLSIREWGMAERLWTGDEDALLSMACGKNFVPNDRQAAKLLALRQKALDEGFVAAEA